MRGWANYFNVDSHDRVGRTRLVPDAEFRGRLVSLWLRSWAGQHALAIERAKAAAATLAT